MVMVMIFRQNLGFWQKVFRIKKHDRGNQDTILWYKELGEERLWGITPDLILVEDGVDVPERTFAYARFCEVRSMKPW